MERDCGFCVENWVENGDVINTKFAKQVNLFVDSFRGKLPFCQPCTRLFVLTESTFERTATLTFPANKILGFDIYDLRQPRRRHHCKVHLRLFSHVLLPSAMNASNLLIGVEGQPSKSQFTVPADEEIGMRVCFSRPSVMWLICGPPRTIFPLNPRLRNPIIRYWMASSAQTYAPIAIIESSFTRARISFKSRRH